MLLRAVRSRPNRGKSGNRLAGHKTKKSPKVRTRASPARARFRSCGRVRRQAPSTCRGNVYVRSALPFSGPKTLANHLVLDVLERRPASSQDRSCPPSRTLSHRIADTDVLRQSKNRRKGRETVPDANLSSPCQTKPNSDDPRLAHLSGRFPACQQQIRQGLRFFPAAGCGHKMMANRRQPGNHSWKIGTRQWATICFSVCSARAWAC